MGCLLSSPADKYRSGGDDKPTTTAAASKPEAAADGKPEPLQKQPSQRTSKPGTHIPVRTTGEVHNYPGEKPKLDPKDFQLVGLKGETRVKQPGSISGQAFMIDQCEDCDIYLVDFCGQVTVDECKNCRIFVGPTEGSIFIRDSKGSTFACVGRQIRMRDCMGCSMAVFCRTRPIVESSTDIGFTCFDLHYAALAGQLKAANLSPLQNFWSNVFDFTPKPGNFYMLPAGSRAEELLKPMPQDMLQAAGVGPMTTQAPGEGPLIVTYGEREPLPNHADGYMFALFPAAKAEGAKAFIDSMVRKADVGVLHVNQAQINVDHAGKLASAAKWSRAAERDIQIGQAVGVELVVPVADYAATSKLVTAAHGFVTDSEDAGTLFRYMGIEG